jgi:hypothetical protein
MQLAKAKPAMSLADLVRKAKLTPSDMFRNAGGKELHSVADLLKHLQVPGFDWLGFYGRTRGDGLREICGVDLRSSRDLGALLVEVMPED